MNRSRRAAEHGFTLLELLVVFAIIGALASIALPYYRTSLEKSLAVSCQSNRHHIEQAEISSYLANKTLDLSIDPKWQCPSGGTYVWLVSDPQDPDYPTVGCSVHFAGSGVTPDLGTGSVPETPAAPLGETEEQTTETPTATPGEALGGLTDTVRGLNLPGKVEDALVKWIEKATKEYEKGQIDKAVKTLDSFQRAVEQKQNNIDAAQAAVLIQKAEEAQQLLRTSL